MPIPKLVVTAALMATQMALTASRRIKGPRLDEAKVTTADYGTPLPRFWGIRRFECPIIWAEDLREEKETTKTKGGKYDNWKYYGTFAVLVADQEIDAVRRIWLDRQLAYDASASGPVSVASAAGVDLSDTLRIYLGTEDQDPDPRYVAWCEDRYGPDSAPAYRGAAYLVFEDLPLEKFGNRIPQVTVEAVSVKSDAFPWDTYDAPSPCGYRLWGFTYSPDFTKFICGVDEDYFIWDVPTQTMLTQGVLSPVGTGMNVDRVGLYNDGTFKLTSGGDLYTYSADGLIGSVATDYFDPEQEEIWVVRDGDGAQHTGTIPWSSLHEFTFDGTYIDPATATGADWKPGCFVCDAYGDVWVLGCDYGPFVDATTLYFYRLINFSGRDPFVNFHSVTLPGAGPTNKPVGCHAEGAWLVQWDGSLVCIDDETFTLTNTIANGWEYSTNKALANHDSRRSTVWLTFREIDIVTGAVIRTIDPQAWKAEDADWSIYDPINHAIICFPQFDELITWRYLDRIGSEAVTLKTVVDTVCDWAGLDDRDTDALTQPIAGYSVTPGAGKDMIDPLLSIHDVDARPHDFAIQFVNRGSAASGTILTGDFVREGDEARYKVTIRQDTDLPKRVTFNFADGDKDQEVNTAIAQRPLDAVDSQREETIDLSTYVADPDTAQQLVDRYFRRLWNSREQVANALTAQQLAIEPGDVKTLSLDGVTRAMRLDKMTVGQGRIECTWTRDEAGVATLNAATTGAPMEGHDDEVIAIPAPTKGFLLDVPLAVDADSAINPLLYSGAGAYAQLPFPGSVIYRGDDGTFDEIFATITAGTTWGTCNEVLATANPNLWDRGNSLNIALQNGSLTNCTEANIDTLPSFNLLLVGNPENGWEYLNFTTATLEGDGTYTLSGFKRGRRGTEGMVGEHGAGEMAILVDALTAEEMGIDEIGSAMAFKAQSLGRLLEFADVIAVDFAGNTLKPYAPARVKWVYDGTDLLGTIFRRTRVGGSWNGGSTIPLAENSEEYEVEIYLGAVLKRTITVTGTNAFTYTAAMAAADGITLPTPPAILAYQISDIVGRGFALAA